MLDIRHKIVYTGSMTKKTHDLIETYRQRALMYEDIQRLRLQGWKLQDIADRYGISRQRVFQIVGARQPRKIKQDE